METIKKVDNNCFILIHDYRQQKLATSIRGYEFVEKYLDVIEFKDNLYVFKKKKNINFMELERDLENIILFRIKLTERTSINFLTIKIIHYRFE